VLLLLSATKLVVEVALMCLLGQGVLYVLTGPKRADNLFYQLLQMATRPFVAVTRRLTPALVADRHVPFVVFFLLSVAWVIVTIEKVRYCVEVGVEVCR
jgi:hypothetical protein